MSEALILMSTYNGEAFLSAQLDSIRQQDFTEWTLLIRDDGSNDQTHDIIKHYSKLDPRIRLLSDGLGNVKPAQSFATLLLYAQASPERFIFFSDQDDIWIENKLSLQMTLLKKLIAQHGETMPLLVFSDLKVVDENLKTIHASFLQYENLAHQTLNPLPSLLIQNWVAGCSAGFNQALLKIAVPVPSSALMHDWWLMLCVAAKGQIGYIHEPTVLYRQHGKNQIGSSGFRGKLISIFSSRSYFCKSISKYTQGIKSRIAQAESLLARLEERNADHTLVKNFCQLKNHSRWTRLFHAAKQPLRPQGITRKIGFLTLLFLL